MAVKQIFNCDICKKEFGQRDDNGQVSTCGGMVGFHTKNMLDENKVMKEHLLQYNFDLCPECNKKMVDFYFELGGK